MLDERLNPTELLEFARGMDPYVRSRGLERPLSLSDARVALSATIEPDTPEAWTADFTDEQRLVVTETVGAATLVIHGIRGAK